MKAFRPYAVTLRGTSPAPQFHLGRLRRTHVELLAEHDLEANFLRAPRDFVMGRILDTEAALFVDTASDHHAATLGHDKPLSCLPQDDKTLFEQCLRQRFPGRRMLLLEEGISFRVSNLNEKKIARILSGRLRKPSWREL